MSTFDDFMIDEAVSKNRQIDRLTAQRAELIAALRDAATEFDACFTATGNPAARDAAAKIRAAVAAATGGPKFEHTYCSQCGREFGPGNHGYSRCDSHAGQRAS